MADNRRASERTMQISNGENKALHFPNAVTLPRNRRAILNQKESTNKKVIKGGDQNWRHRGEITLFGNMFFA